MWVFGSLCWKFGCNFSNLDNFAKNVGEGIRVQIRVSKNYTIMQLDWKTLWEFGNVSKMRVHRWQKWSEGGLNVADLK